MPEIVNTEKSVKLPELLDEFRIALNKEIETIKKGGQSSSQLYGGKLIPSNTTDFWYTFNIEYMPDLPADTPCKLTVGNEHFDVTVIRLDDNTITISSVNKLPDNIGRAKLDNGSTVLMERLIKRIEDNADSDNPAANRMLATSDLSLEKAYHAIHSIRNQDIVFDAQNNDEQRKAIISSLNNDITYIWGPPGTGKTTVIKDIILNMLRRDRSVLLVSHTNTAVDGAIKKVANQYNEEHGGNEEESYPILRLGNISDSGISERVRIDYHIKQSGKELQEKKQELIKEKENLNETLIDIQNNFLLVNWTEASRIEEIKGLFSSILELQKRRDQNQLVVKEISKRLTRLKDDTPEYKEYLVIERKLKEEKRKLKQLESNWNSFQSDIAQSKTIIEEAETELAKLQKKRSLQSQLSELLPISLQQENVDSMKKEIDDEQQKIEEITNSILEQKEIISKNNDAKGFISGFFSKKNIEKANSLIANHQKQLDAVEDSLEGKKTAYNVLRKDLIEARGLQEQIDLLDTTKTESEWERVKQDALAKMDAAKQGQELIRPAIASITKSVQNLDLAAEALEKPFQEIAKLSKEEKRIKKELEDLSIQQRQDELHSLLADEETICNYITGKTPEGQPIERRIQILEMQLHRAEKEVEHLDLEDLHEDEKVCKEAIHSVENEIAEIERQLDELRKIVILKAKVLGTTLTKSYLDDTLQSRTFDTVILDEASMASIPALWCTALLAEKNIVIVGDFIQLPPIVMAKGNSNAAKLALKWLGQDIFDISGMQYRLKNYNVPDNFVALISQYRMEPEIAETANIYYDEYNTKLESPGADSHERNEDRNSFNQWYPLKEDTAVLHLVDTSNLHAWATGVPRGKGSSRLNYYSASLCVEMAFRFLGEKLASKKAEKDPSILIITPYKPHATRIYDLIKLRYKTLHLAEDSNYIEVGTVHSFQGKEADIVIFDLVVDEPHWRANLFMTDPDVEDGLKKLYNVAVTRAKYKLFVVGNMKYFKQRAKGNALSRLLETLRRNGAVTIDAKESYPSLSFSMNLGKQYSLEDVKNYMWCTEDQFYNYICTEIQSCKRQMVIYSPFISDDRLSKLLPLLSDAARRGCKIVVVTKLLSERGRTERSAYAKREKALNDHGIVVVHKKGMHEKNIYVDEHITWVGSLNMLSFTGNTGEFMIRIVSEKIARDSIKELGCDKLVKAFCEDGEGLCPICGGEMTLAESGDGGFYWACINGDYTRNREEQYPHDGMLRCKCGGTYRFEMKKQPRWICEENNHHYKVLKINDLKLEKMYNLLTDEEHARVREYYLSAEKDSVVNAWKKFEKFLKDKEDGEQLSLL